MKVFVIVGRNGLIQNISARAVYSTRELAQAHLDSKDAMWFDDEAEIIELEVDAGVQKHNLFGVGANA